MTDFKGKFFLEKVALVLKSRQWNGNDVLITCLIPVVPSLALVGLSSSKIDKIKRKFKEPTLNKDVLR